MRRKIVKMKKEMEKEKIKEKEIEEKIEEETDEKVCPHCCERHKKRSPEEEKKLLTRLRKVEGQIRGIEKMVENDAYCPDILIQVSAATSALNSFSKELLASHIRSCVVHDIKEDKEETIDELCSLLQKLMK
jgi:CsoR family transcriptional regulator, copper-sensing transcriptional repressor